MKAILNKKNLKTFFYILIIDIILIGCWILYFHPEGSEAIFLLFILPTVFLINLVIASILYFIKRYYTPFFIANAFLTSSILYLFWMLYIDIYGRIIWEDWELYIDGIEYSISYPSLKNGTSEYNILYSPEKGMSNGVEGGMVVMQNDTLYFTSTDGAKYFIYKNYLYGFKNNEKIKVKKRY